MVANDNEDIHKSIAKATKRLKAYCLLRGFDKPIYQFVKKEDVKQKLAYDGNEMLYIRRWYVFRVIVKNEVKGLGACISKKSARSRAALDALNKMRKTTKSPEGNTNYDNKQPSEKQMVDTIDTNNQLASNEKNEKISQQKVEISQHDHHSIKNDRISRQFEKWKIRVTQL